MLVQNVVSDGMHTSPYDICIFPPAFSHWVLFLQFFKICDAVVVTTVVGIAVVVGTVVVGAIVVVLLAKVDAITVVVFVVVADGVDVDSVGAVVVDVLAFVVVDIGLLLIMQDTLHVDIINFSLLVNIVPCFTCTA